MEDVLPVYADLVMTTDMEQLQMVMLYIVHISSGGWGRFLSSLPTLPQFVGVLKDVANVDCEEDTVVIEDDGAEG